MKAHELLSLNLKRGERVTVTTTEGKTVETYYDGLHTFGIETISDPDTQLEPRFRAPTLDFFNGCIHVPLSRIQTIKRPNHEPIR